VSGRKVEGVVNFFNGRIPHKAIPKCGVARLAQSWVLTTLMREMDVLTRAQLPSNGIWVEGCCWL